MNWKFAYTIGFHPWEDAAKDEPFVRKFAEILDREERGRQPPYGRAPYGLPPPTFLSSFFRECRKSDSNRHGVAATGF